jgi:RNA polymerase sigma-70 factor (ECF subfamily)
MPRRTPAKTPLERSVADPQAFDEVFRRYSRDLLIFFARRTFDAEAARDLMAETLAEAFRTRARFRGGVDAQEAAYVWGIARHRLARWRRSGSIEHRAVHRLGIQLEPLTEDQTAEVVRAAQLVELRRLMAPHIRALPERQRGAIELRVIDGLDYDEVARRLGISEQTARARVSRGLRRLGDALSADLSFQELMT